LEIFQSRFSVCTLFCLSLLVFAQHHDLGSLCVCVSLSVGGDAEADTYGSSSCVKNRDYVGLLRLLLERGAPPVSLSEDLTASGGRGDWACAFPKMYRQVRPSQGLYKARGRVFVSYGVCVCVCLSICISVCCFWHACNSQQPPVTSTIHQPPQKPPSPFHMHTQAVRYTRPSSHHPQKHHGQGKTETS
jgi:hypothetical protein